MNGQENDFHPGRQLADSARRCKAIQLRHVDVKDGDLRPQRLNLGQRRTTIVGFAYNHHPAGGLDCLFQSLTAAGHGRQR
jgi:hypothetical protein